MVKKLASQLINSNPARPRKDLITPELHKGNRKLTEGIKVNKDTLDQVEKKPRIPMAKVGDMSERDLEIFYQNRPKELKKTISDLASFRNWLLMTAASSHVAGKLIRPSTVPRAIMRGGARGIAAATVGGALGTHLMKGFIESVELDDRLNRQIEKTGETQMEKHASDMRAFFELGFKKELEKHAGLVSRLAAEAVKRGRGLLQAVKGSAKGSITNRLSTEALAKLGPRLKKLKKLKSAVGKIKQGPGLGERMMNVSNLRRIPT